MYGQQLKNQRKLTGVSQQKVAQATQISQQAISDYENDKNEPTISTCVKLADFYGISVDELIGHEVKKNW